MAGVVNDVIVGLPLGISSFCYLLICSVTAYVRNITLSPNFINDWLSFLFTILLVNSVQVIILDLIFLIQVDYMKYLINTGFTFIFYPLFFFIFNYVNKKIIVKLND
jgi:cell shape-determining protein MreD